MPQPQPTLPTNRAFSETSLKPLHPKTMSMPICKGGSPMRSPISNSVQGHLTLALPMKSPADGQALRDKVPGVMPAFSKAADAVGTLHYYRLMALDATRFLFLAEYDSELEAILRAMATELGPVMDQHLVSYHVQRCKAVQRLDRH